MNSRSLKKLNAYSVAAMILTGSSVALAGGSSGLGLVHANGIEGDGVSHSISSKGIEGDGVIHARPAGIEGDGVSHSISSKGIEGDGVIHARPAGIEGDGVSHSISNKGIEGDGAARRAAGSSSSFVSESHFGCGGALEEADCALMFSR
jgi:hypothetical protein